MCLFGDLFHLDWTSDYPLQYYSKCGKHTIFANYTINFFGIIKNKHTGKELAYKKSTAYNATNVFDDEGVRMGIQIARAMVSSLLGKPHTLQHTAEHIDNDNKDNDIISELTWIDKTGQQKNRSMPQDNLSAFIIVRDGIELTLKEWVSKLKNEKNDFGRPYTRGMIYHYVQRNQMGFYYKTYDDLPNEIWKKVSGSDNKLGWWMVSDKNRVSFNTKHGRNIIQSSNFKTDTYPTICINGKNIGIHVVVFETFYPEEYAKKTSSHLIRHLNDDKHDFRPENLAIGTAHENAKDAHDNGRHDGKRSGRVACISYVDGVLEKTYNSQLEVVEYLLKEGYSIHNTSNIKRAMKKPNHTCYGRTWSY